MEVKDSHPLPLPNLLRRSRQSSLRSRRRTYRADETQAEDAADDDGPPSPPSPFTALANEIFSRRDNSSGSASPEALLAQPVENKPRIKKIPLGTHVEADGKNGVVVHDDGEHVTIRTPHKVKMGIDKTSERWCNFKVESDRVTIVEATKPKNPKKATKAPPWPPKPHFASDNAVHLVTGEENSMWSENPLETKETPLFKVTERATWIDNMQQYICIFYLL